MLIKKNIKILLLLTLLAHAGLFATRLPIYLHYEQEIVNIFADEMAKQYQLLCIGGGGRMPHDVEEIEVNFVAYRHATVEEARELEVKAIERLLCLINKNSNIRPFLREHPFKSNRVSVSISFHNEEDRQPLDGSVATVFLSRNRLVYRALELRKQKRAPFINMTCHPVEIDDKDIEVEFLIPLTEEPYEDALEIVQKGPSCLKK